MAPGARIVRELFALGIGVLSLLALWAPIYYSIGYGLEGLFGISRLNPMTANLAADLIAPLFGGFATVKLAPEPKRTILWLPAVILALTVAGLIVGDDDWSLLLSAAVGLFGALLGGRLASRAG